LLAEYVIISTVITCNTVRFAALNPFICNRSTLVTVAIAIMSSRNQVMAIHLGHTFFANAGVSMTSALTAHTSNCMSPAIPRVVVVLDELVNFFLGKMYDTAIGKHGVDEQAKLRQIGKPCANC
jgi:hypothetical protein